MIKLTLLKTGKPHWVIVEHVTGVGFGALDDVEGTAVTRVNDEHGYPPLFVQETPEEVAQMILDYKMALVRYNAASTAAAGCSADRVLKRLAGLELTP